MLINGVVYKYYIEAGKRAYEYFSEDGAHDRILKLETSVLNEKGNDVCYVIV